MRQSFLHRRTITVLEKHNQTQSDSKPRHRRRKTFNSSTGKWQTSANNHNNNNNTDQKHSAHNHNSTGCKAVMMSSDDTGSRNSNDAVSIHGANRSSKHSASNGLEKMKRGRLESKLKRARNLHALFKKRSDDNLHQFLLETTKCQDETKRLALKYKFNMMNTQLLKDVAALEAKIHEYERGLEALEAQHTTTAAPSGEYDAITPSASKTHSVVGPFTNVHTIIPASALSQYAVSASLAASTSSSQPGNDIHASVSRPSPGLDTCSSTKHFTDVASSRSDDSCSSASSSAFVGQQSSRQQDVMMSVHQSDWQTAAMDDLRSRLDRIESQLSAYDAGLLKSVTSLSQDVGDLIDIHQVEMTNLRSELRRVEEKLSYTLHEHHSSLDERFSNLVDKLTRMIQGLAKTSRYGLIDRISSSASLAAARQRRCATSPPTTTPGVANNVNSGLCTDCGVCTAFDACTLDFDDFEENVFFHRVLAPILNSVFTVFALIMNLFSVMVQFFDIFIGTRPFRYILLPLVAVYFTLSYVVGDRTLLRDYVIRQFKQKVIDQYF